MPSRDQPPMASRASDPRTASSSATSLRDRQQGLLWQLRNG
jgi:hypothetical protein